MLKVIKLNDVSGLNWVKVRKNEEHRQKSSPWFSDFYSVPAGYSR